MAGQRVQVLNSTTSCGFGVVVGDSATIINPLKDNNYECTKNTHSSGASVAFCNA